MKYSVEVEDTETGITLRFGDQVINFHKEEQINMSFDTPVIDTETKPARKPMKNRKPPCSIDSDLITTVNFLLRSGKSYEEVAIATSSSTTTVRRIEQGHYNDRLVSI